MGQQGPEAPPHCETRCSPGSRHTAPPPKLSLRPHPAPSLRAWHPAVAHSFWTLQGRPSQALRPSPSPHLPSGPQMWGARLDVDLGSQEGRDECLGVSRLDASRMIQPALPWSATFPGVWVVRGASCSLEGPGLPVGWGRCLWRVHPGLTRRADPGSEPPQGSGGVCWPCGDLSSGNPGQGGKLHSAAHSTSLVPLAWGPLGRWTARPRGGEVRG